MPVSIDFSGKSLIFNKPFINEKQKEEEKKEECLEPVKTEKTEKTGKGLNDLQEKLSSLKFDDKPISEVLKGSRKKRNISFTY